MPMTHKGTTILRHMREEYGAEKGKHVFYASANAGKIAGVHKRKTLLKHKEGH